MGSRRFWLIVATIWFVFGVLVGTQVWLSMLDHHHSVPRLLSYYVLVSEGWLLITWLIVKMTARWPVVPPKFKNLAIHGVVAFVIGPLHVALWIVLLLWMKPFDKMTAEPQQIRVGSILLFRMPIELTMYIAVLAVVQAIDYYDKYRARSIETAELRSSLNDARLHALELQLQPHFLFNALNSVSSLVRMNKNDDAVRMIALLSDLLRSTLDRSGAQRVPLEDETNTLRRYLEIQRMRFADRLSIDIRIDDDVRGASVPPLILQPLAENAVRHGIARSADEGRIDVHAFRRNGFVTIEMFNTGKLDEPHLLGIGLTNTMERLRQMYGERQEFDLRSERGGVLASLSIPMSGT